MSDTERRKILLEIRWRIAGAVAEKRSCIRYSSGWHRCDAVVAELKDLALVIRRKWEVGGA